MSDPSEKLLPCPFCGSLPIYESHNIFYHSMGCGNDHCEANPQVVAKTKEDCFTYWNARSTPPPRESGDGEQDWACEALGMMDLSHAVLGEPPAAPTPTVSERHAACSREILEAHSLVIGYSSLFEKRHVETMAILAKHFPEPPAGEKAESVAKDLDLKFLSAVNEIEELYGKAVERNTGAEFGYFRGVSRAAAMDILKKHLLTTPQPEEAALREEVDSDAWDDQIEKDILSGKLDHLIKEVRPAGSGTLRERFETLKAERDRLVEALVCWDEHFSWRTSKGDEDGDHHVHWRVIEACLEKTKAALSQPGQQKEGA